MSWCCDPSQLYEKEGNCLYNTVAVIDADGSVLGVYRKTHIPDDHYYQENSIFHPGIRDFGREDQVWQHRCGYLLGSVVPGDCQMYGADGERSFCCTRRRSA